MFCNFGCKFWIFCQFLFCYPNSHFDICESCTQVQGEGAQVRGDAAVYCQGGSAGRKGSDRKNEGVGVLTSEFVTPL